MQSVLLGGRTAPVSRSLLRAVLHVWLPVLIMLAVIVRESTEGFSGLHTSSLIRPIWQAIFGAATDERWEWTHHLIRKTGHFLGYGTLGLTWLRAWLLTWIYPFRLRPASAWRRWSFTMAIVCTSLIACMDELHQTFLPDRTGLMQDVVLDTTGAFILCGAMALLFWLRSRRSAPFIELA